MNFEIIFVLLALAGMIAALIWDGLRPGMVLLTVVILFLCVGILTPKEMLEGFSNKGMITVGMLFLVSEGIRQSGALGQLIKKLLPEGKTTVFKAQLRMLPPIAFVSAFLNNTPVVVIFAPIIKRWAESVKLPATKFLIPLSYVTILGGICTLIGTSTNLVVHGMILDAGYEGFTMFELGKVGIFIALTGIIYLFVFSSKLLPDSRTDRYEEGEEDGNLGSLHRVEAVLGSRFPGINKTLGEFNFTRHYGAIVKEVKSGGQRFTRDLDKVTLHEGDTLVLWADDTFVPTWGESSVFLLLANGTDGTEPVSRKKRWLALGLLIFMIVGATVGELPVVKDAFPGVRLDMFFFVCITTVIMAWTKIFPPKKYTKYISWDILITIACAFAISKAMENSGFATLIARHIIDMAHDIGPYALLAILFIITNIFSELITNNAAAALSFPIALSVATQLGVDPTPFFVVICMAASASFSTPIGYQTNLIVQGIGSYKFTDFVRIGLPLNLITFLISVFVIPMQNSNIYPIFDRMMTREDKERLLKQRSVMVWFTGLSGSGKSTVAMALERELHKCGLLCRILDGDNIRSGINNNLGFSAEDRVENIRRIAEVSKLFIDTGVITIAAFISPNNDLREMAASIIGKENFLEIYVSTPIEECERRDVKGLYAKARRGEIKDFTGVSALFEVPEHPDLMLDTSVLSLEESVSRLLGLILPKVSPVKKI